MQAGKLNKQLSVLVPTRYTSERTGERTVTTGATVANVWASITEKSAAEVEQAAQQVSQTVYNVSIRYRPEVTHECYLLQNNGRVLQIIDVINVDERNRELRITAVVTGRRSKDLTAPLSLSHLTAAQWETLTGEQLFRMIS